MKDFCKDCKLFYGAVSLEACDKAFELFKDKWKDLYPGALKVWDNNFNHVRQLYSYPSAVRRIMYTTSAIESVNSILRKVTKKGMFENQNAVFKKFYLRFTRELAKNKKWDGFKLTNWPLVLNQLTILDETCDRITKYL